MSEDKSDNLLSIQLLRGVAAFLVLMCHAVGSKLGTTNIISQIAIHGWVGVEIFFIISGFIIPYAMFKKNYKVSDFGVFFIKRIVRIEPPYIISILLTLLLMYITTLSSWYKGPPFQINWPNTLGHLGYINAFTGSPWLNVAYWTLAIEFEYYLILALIFPLITSKNKIYIYITYCALLATTFIVFPGKGRHILYYMPFFLMGISLFLYKVKRISLIDLFILTGLATAGAFYAHGILLAIISIGVLLVIEFVKKVPKPFLLLGTISYSLYLTHNLIVTRFEAIAKRFFPHMHISIVLILSICTCLILAYIYYVIIEKPTINLGKRINYKHPSKINSGNSNK